MRSKDPIEQIRENLLEYEEPYRLGAWEEFKRHRQAKIRAKQLRWIAAAAAAVLFALFASYLVTDVTVRTSEQIAEAPPEQAEHPDPGMDAILQEITPPEDSGSGGEPDDAADEAEEDGLPPPAVPEPESEPAGETPAIFTDLLTYKQIPHWYDYTGLSNRADETRETLTGLSGTTPPADTGSIRGDTDVATPQLAARYNTRLPVQSYDRHITESDLSALNSHRPGISFGLAYSPLINIHQSSTDWNIGGGFSVEWDFMENLALSSGLFVAQSQLEFRTDQVRLTGTEQPVSSADLEIDFLSLEIPFNLQYTMAGRFFISGGITSASYLKEQYTYHYQTQRMTTTDILIEGEYQPVTKLVTLEETMAQSEPSLSSFNPLAFYNFSLGYRFDEAGNGRFTITIEPFFKLPARSASSRSVTYSTGGLQLKVAF